MQCTWTWYTSAKSGASAFQGDVELRFMVRCDSGGENGHVRCMIRWWICTEPHVVGAELFASQVNGEFTNEIIPLIDASGWGSVNVWRQHSISLSTCLDGFPTTMQMTSRQLGSYAWWKMTVACEGDPCPWVIMQDPNGFKGTRWQDPGGPQWWIGRRNFGGRGRMEMIRDIPLGTFPIFAFPFVVVWMRIVRSE